MADAFSVDMPGWQVHGGAQFTDGMHIARPQQQERMQLISGTNTITFCALWFLHAAQFQARKPHGSLMIPVVYLD